MDSRVFNVDDGLLNDSWRDVDTVSVVFQDFQDRGQNLILKRKNVSLLVTCGGQFGRQIFTGIALQEEVGKLGVFL